MTKITKRERLIEELIKKWPAYYDIPLGDIADFILARNGLCL